MNLLRILRNLKLAQLWTLFRLCFFNMGKVLPTWRATHKSVAHANRLYGTQHHRNTPANAFRHAFWNYLIARKCLKRSEQTSQVLEWTKRVTDLHEDLFPNSDLARSMDLHNNRVGRMIFVEYAQWQEEAVQELLQEKTRKSIHVQSEEELKSIPEDCLVHMIQNFTQ